MISYNFFSLTHGFKYKQMILNVNSLRQFKMNKSYNYQSRMKADNNQYNNKYILYTIDNVLNHNLIVS